MSVVVEGEARWEEVGGDFRLADFELAVGAQRGAGFESRSAAAASSGDGAASSGANQTNVATGAAAISSSARPAAR